MADVKENMDLHETDGEQFFDTEEAQNEKREDITALKLKHDTVEEKEEQLDERDTMIQNLREGNIRLKNEVTTAQGDLLRSRADYENLKKRTTRERFEEVKRAKKAVLMDFLGVLDNFERALETKEKERITFVQGIEMIHKQLLDVFSQNHVYEIQAKGTPFNPYMHEAVMQLPTCEFPENMVVQVLQKGYSFNGELLRPSRVSVSAPVVETGPPPAPPYIASDEASPTEN